MQFILNDLSIHRQFSDIPTFRCSIKGIMEARNLIRKSGQTFYCSKNILSSFAIYDQPLSKSVQQLSRDERRAFMQWITHDGPYWNDTRQHQSNDWFELSEEIVTDSSVGEAAWCVANNINSHLISLSPSNYESSPLRITWKHTQEYSQDIEVVNLWNISTISKALHETPQRPKSWVELEAFSRSKFLNVLFLVDCFSPLRNSPFIPSASERIIFILDTLNKFKICFTSSGSRTTEGNEIYQNFFTGKKGNGGRGSLFSDSSDQEKVDFKAEMTFPLQQNSKETLFCTWHGKIQTPQLRVHFSHPISSSEPLYIAYIGPKITKR